MNAQQMEYVRLELATALADSGARTKGQLAEFEDSPLAETSKYKRQAVRTVDIGARKVQRWVDPVFCAETRSRVRPAAPIAPSTFSSSSWRRALCMLPAEQQAWLRYAYARDMDFAHQQMICRYIWNTLDNSAAVRGSSKKTRGRLRALAWLAVQETAGGGWSVEYQASELAQLAGVKPDNWSKHYAPRWGELLLICRELDEIALQAVCGRRVKNRAAR